MALLLLIQAWRGPALLAFYGQGKQNMGLKQLGKEYDMRHGICAVLPLPSRLSHFLCVVLPLPCFSLRQDRCPCVSTGTWASCRLAGDMTLLISCDSLQLVFRPSPLLPTHSSIVLEKKGTVLEQESLPFLVVMLTRTFVTVSGFGRATLRCSKCSGSSRTRCADDPLPQMPSRREDSAFLLKNECLSLVFPLHSCL